MSSDDRDIWYQLGYALERLRDAPGRIPALETLQERRGAGRRESGREDPGRSPGDGGRGARGGVGAAVGGALSDEMLERLLRVGARTLGPRLLLVLPLRKRTGALGLLASAVAGAAAAAVAEGAAVLGDPDKRLSLDSEGITATLLAGAGRGVTYAGVLEPRLPGPAFLLGFAYGTAEYLTAEWGGLSRLLGSTSPHRKLPFLAEALEGEDRTEVDFPEHLVFGLSLALLYDALRPKRGMEEEDDGA